MKEVQQLREKGSSINTDTLIQDIPQLNVSTLLNTEQLAKLYNVKRQTVLTNKYVHGHFKGYISVARETKKCSQLLWRKENVNKQ